MTSPAEYARLLARLCAAHPRPTVTIAVRDALNQVAAADVTAGWDSPRFDNSQMDGYAVPHLAGGEFTVGATVAAGDAAHDCRGRAIPIMTGAPVPADATAIIPVEHATPAAFLSPGDTVRLPAAPPQQFIRARGSDGKAGDLLIPAGTVINPIHIAVLASQGITDIAVHAPARALIVTGGKEITTAQQETPPSASMAYPPAPLLPDANGPLLTALSMHYGIQAVAHVHTNDDAETLHRDLARACETYNPDVIITAGGISAGKFEVIRQVITACDPQAWFGHVTQQPGGPQGHGTFAGVPVICLPGNPISALVSFRLFIAPLLGTAPTSHTAVLTQPIQGLSHKDQFLRARLDNPSAVRATPLGGTSSHLLLQALGATALVRIPAGSTLRAGDPVEVFPFGFAEQPAAAAVPPADSATTSPGADSSAPVAGSARVAEVIVSSTRAARGEYADRTGPVLVEFLREHGFAVSAAQVVADADIESAVAAAVARAPHVLLTTGGTGISADDRTVEAIRPHIDKELPGIPVALWQSSWEKVPTAVLSRSIAGVAGSTFIMALPGSTGGVRDGIAVLEPIIEHIVAVLSGTERGDHSHGHSHDHGRVHTQKGHHEH